VRRRTYPPCSAIIHLRGIADRTTSGGTSYDRAVLKEMLDGVGAIVMGRTSFDENEGDGGWGDGGPTPPVPPLRRPADLRGLRVYPPGDKAALFVPAEGTGCAGTPPGPQLVVRTITAG
jgi:hypothetical protein